MLSTKEISATLDILTKVTDTGIDSTTAQSVLQVLSNLDSAKTIQENDTQSVLNSTENSIRDQLVLIGRAAIQNSIRDEEPVTMSSSNFNGYFQRLSPDSVQKLTIMVNSTVNNSVSASVFLPPDTLNQFQLDENEGVDVILVVSKNKPNRGGFVNDTSVRNLTSMLVADAETVKLQFEVSGKINDYGEFVRKNRRELPVNYLKNPVNITIPFKSVSENASTTCSFYNTTSSEWSTSGCLLIAINRTSNFATCSCTHLTEFSVTDARDGAIAAASSANIDEAVNIGALANLNLTTNAIGLYIAVALLCLYVCLGALCKWLDRKEARELEDFYNDPEKNLADAISRNKDLYNIFVAGKMPELLPTRRSRIQRRQT